MNDTQRAPAAEPITGVRLIQVRVTFDDQLVATVSPVDGEIFTGEGPADETTVFMAVWYPGGRTAVLRFEQPLEVRPGETTTVDALLVDGR